MKIFYPSIVVNLRAPCDHCHVLKSTFFSLPGKLAVLFQEDQWKYFCRQSMFSSLSKQSLCQLYHAYGFQDKCPIYMIMQLKIRLVVLGSGYEEGVICDRWSYMTPCGVGVAAGCRMWGEMGCFVREYRQKVLSLIGLRTTSSIRNPTTIPTRSIQPCCCKIGHRGQTLGTTLP